MSPRIAILLLALAIGGLAWFLKPYYDLGRRDIPAELQTLGYQDAKVVTIDVTNYFYDMYGTQLPDEFEYQVTAVKSGNQAVTLKVVSKLEKPLEVNEIAGVVP